jgi:hypothetical protein
MHQNAVRFLQFMSHLSDTGNLQLRVARAKLGIPADLAGTAFATAERDSSPRGSVPSGLAGPPLRP